MTTSLEYDMDRKTMVRIVGEALESQNNTSKPFNQEELKELWNFIATTDALLVGKTKERGEIFSPLEAVGIRGGKYWFTWKFEALLREMFNVNSGPMTIRLIDGT